VIPDGTSIRDADHAFQSSQVIGYYDPSSGQLVFIGTRDPSPFERYILAHELTHADDDQHFDLDRLNVLENACDDEGLMAATGAAEGSAVYFSQQVLARFFSDSEQEQVFLHGGSRPPDVPPFIYELATWPYVDGPEFIRAIESSGGLDAVNRAIREFPASTEQIIHPARFPGDRPVPVDVPDLGPALGGAWRDLDVMDVGEEWLRAALDLQAGIDAAPAADGWGGAQYRAWTDGTRVAVVLQTVWDTTNDAAQFLGAMRRRIGGRDDAAVGSVAGDPKGVVALYGSDAATLHRLEAALR
jgi:hypothetical protein